MTDDVAKTSLVFDATQAAAGARDFKAAADTVVAANDGVVASETKTAAAVTAAEATKSSVRAAGAASARNAATLQAAAAAAGADGVVAATNRVVTSLASQSRMLDGIAKQWDPFVAAAQRAQTTLDKLVDAAARPGTNQAQAATMVQQATLKLNAANANLALANNASAGPSAAVQTSVPTAGIAAAANAIDDLRGQMAQLRTELDAGVSNAGQYAGAWDQVSASVAAYEVEAKRASAVTVQMIAQSKMAQDAANAQSNINQLTGVQTSPGSVGGVDVSPFSSAQQSAAVFQAQFDAEDKLTAENAKLAASYNPIKAASQAYEASLAEIDTAVQRGIITDAQADIQRTRVAKTTLDAAGMNRQLGLSADGAGVSVSHLSGNTSGMTRELLVLGHEVVNGNWTRFSGSLLVLTEYLGTARDKIFDFGKALFTTGAGLAGLASVAAVGVLTAFAVAAENSALRLERLQNSLALVRDDFASASTAADAAARSLAGTSTLSTADARTGINAVYQNPAFQGTQDQAKAIALSFANLSTSLGESAVDWKRLQDAMVNPAATLQTLLDQNHLKGVTQELVNQAKQLQDSGDKAGAFAIVLGAVTSATQGLLGRQTPLEQALHDLEQQFTRTGQNGKTFAGDIGGPILTGIVFAVTAVNSLIAALKQLNEIQPGGALAAIMANFGPAFGAGLAGASAGASAGDALSRLLGLPPGGLLGGGLSGQMPAPAASAALPHGVANLTAQASDVASIVDQYFTSKGLNQAAATAIITNMAAESSLDPAKLNPDDNGSPSYGLVQYHGARLTSLQQSSGTATPSLQQQLDQIYADLTTGAYQAVGAALKNLPNTAAGAAVGTSMFTQGFEVPANAAAVGSQRAALAPGYFDRLSGGQAAQAAAAAAPGAGIDPYGPAPLPPGALGAASATGVVNTTTDVTKLADDDARAMGVAGDAAAEAQKKINAFNAALQIKPGNAAYLEGLQKANLELYNAVPAAAAALRAIDEQIAGEDKMAAAWGQGAQAAANATSQVKAEQAARAIAAPGTATYASAVLALTAKYNDLAAATQRVALAQASDQTRDNIAYLQTEISTIGMDYNARELLLANLKNEQDVRRQYPTLFDAEVAGRVKELGQVEQMTLALNQQKAGVDAIAGAFSQSFDTIGNAMAQAFIQGQGAAVNWSNVMTSVIQQVLQQLLKLSVLNPLLNELFGQNNPTIDSAVAGLAKGNGALSGIAKFLTGTSGASTTAASFAPTAADAATFAAQDSSSLFLDAVSGFHTGGVAGFGGTPRYVHPAYFDDAPRYHAGLGSDEVAAILQKGERVLTVAQTARFDGMVRDMGRITAALHHAGGLAGNATSMRDVASDLFAAAPRYHDGFNSDGVTSLLDGMSAMGGIGGTAPASGGKDGAPVTVNLHLNGSGQNVDQFRRSGPQIARQIGSAIRTEMARGRV